VETASKAFRVRMTVHEVLRQAISAKRCVRILTAGHWREICPHALGIKDGHPKALVFQYEGDSVSGLAPGGQWRAFFISDIERATIIDGPWHGGANFVAKAEACLDRIEYRVH